MVSYLILLKSSPERGGGPRKAWWRGLADTRFGETRAPSVTPSLRNGAPPPRAGEDFYD